MSWLTLAPFAASAALSGSRLTSAHGWKRPLKTIRPVAAMAEERTVAAITQAGRYGSVTDNCPASVT